MNEKTIIALNYKHLAYARQSKNGEWVTGTTAIGHRTMALAVDPHQSNSLYVGTDGHGILKTEDYGETWRPLGLEGQIVRAIAISKLKPGTIYAGTKPAALYVSHDYGANWQEIPAFKAMKRWFWFTPAESPHSAYVMDIVLSPVNPNLIVAGVEAGAVLRSEDAGETWQGHLKGALRDCHDLVYHPTDGNWVYEGGGTGAAFSKDAGKTWFQPDPPKLLDLVQLNFAGKRARQANTRGKLDKRYGWAVAADPAAPNIWYFSAAPSPFNAHSEGNAQADIYRCKDGQSWERLSGGLPQALNHFPYALLTDIDAPGHVYAILQNGDVWHSENHGDTWTQLALNIGSVWYRAILV
jgi:photosystem II stability/assembly factor-like uncharacterized protein